MIGSVPTAVDILNRTLKNTPSSVVFGVLQDGLGFKGRGFAGIGAWGVRIFGSGFGSYCIGHRTLLGSKVELILGGIFNKGFRV